MSWAARRGLWLLAAALLSLLVGLTAAIVVVSLLSARDRITLAGGIAVFAAVISVWAVVTVVAGLRWWRWSRMGGAEPGGSRVLVTYGSRRGSTAGIATMIGETLASVGLEADVRPAQTVARVGPYRAVIVGGALYTRRWHPDARRFVRRHAPELRTRPVWLFASGPLGDDADPQAAVPVRQVVRAAMRVGARGTVTFGGRLADDADGPVARKIVAQGRAGDFRDPARIRRWTLAVVDELARVPDAGTARRAAAG